MVNPVTKGGVFACPRQAEQAANKKIIVSMGHQSLNDLMTE